MPELLDRPRDFIEWKAEPVIVRHWEPDAMEWAQKRLVNEWGHSKKFWALNKMRLLGNLEDKIFVGEAAFNKYKVACDTEQEGPAPGNLLTDVGKVVMTTRLTATTLHEWTPGTGSGSWCGFGVGNDATGAVVGNTVLGGTQGWRYMDNGFPTITSGIFTWKTSYQNAEANFTWNEYGISVPGASAAQITTYATAKHTNYTLLNRRGNAGLQAKVSGVSTITLVCTLA